MEENVFATVVEKDYDPSYTTFIRAGKVMTPVHHSSSYDVYLKYGDEEFAIDDEALYNRVNKNDKIPAKLVKYLSKDGKVLKIDIEVEEGSWFRSLLRILECFFKVGYYENITNFKITLKNAKFFR